MGRAQELNEMPKLSRRSIAAGLACAGPIAGVRQAMALIPDDDDADLVARAKAKVLSTKRRELSLSLSPGLLLVLLILARLSRRTTWSTLATQSPMLATVVGLNLS